LLFVLKGVAPPGISVGTIYRAAIPYVWLTLLMMALDFHLPGHRHGICDELSRDDARIAMKAPPFLYRRPHDLDEALTLLADNAGRAQVLAGGQSLVPSLNMRLSSPDMLVDINRIGALRGNRERGDTIRIGALVRHAEVLDSSLIARKAPLLAMAIPYVAHMAVRNRGTTCGSLALATPRPRCRSCGRAERRHRAAQADTSRTVSARDFLPRPLSDLPGRPTR